MEKYRMPLWVPLALLFLIGLFAFVVPSWTTAIANLGKLQGINDAWAGFAGAIIAAVMVIVATLGAAAVAWLSIKGQNRIAILTREEERIEREFPGLIEAREFMSIVVLYFSRDANAKSAAHGLRTLGFPKFGRNYLEVVEGRLPNSADVFRRRLANNLNAVSACVVSVQAEEETLRQIQETNSPMDQAPMFKRLAEQNSMLPTYVGFLHSMNAEVNERIKQLEKRRLVCRSEIERFFED
jgi:hypothetical protein